MMTSVRVVNVVQIPQPSNANHSTHAGAVHALPEGCDPEEGRPLQHQHCQRRHAQGKSIHLGTVNDFTPSPCSPPHPFAR